MPFHCLNNCNRLSLLSVRRKEEMVVSSRRQPQRTYSRGAIPHWTLTTSPDPSLQNFMVLCETERIECSLPPCATFYPRLDPLPRPRPATLRQCGSLHLFLPFSRYTANTIGKLTDAAIPLPNSAPNLRPATPRTAYPRRLPWSGRTAQ